MKKLGFIIFIFISAFFTSQEYKESLKHDYANFLNSLQKKEFKKAVEYIDPIFLEYVSKEQMLNYFQMRFDTKGYTIYISDLMLDIPNKEPIIHDGRNYLEYKYSYNIKIKLDDQEVNKKGKKKNFSSSELDWLDVFKTIFETQKVEYNEQTKEYKITIENVSVASSQDLKSWKFIDFHEGNQQLYKLFLPLEVINPELQ